jgi:hypothetical protein
MAVVPLVLVLVLMAWFIRRASSGSISKDLDALAT